MKIELDEEIIEVACRVCLKFVRQKRCRVSVHDVAAELEKCQLFHTGLDEDELSRVKPPASLPEHLVPFLQMGWHTRSGEGSRESEEALAEGEYLFFKGT
ncbi:hypothetical protein HOP50_02g14780 [Chloropicon primus]|uniref:Uncharacterized protein n=1 Tax=Chloropicon primus TaxID=1764295 RepID=A0A5B8MFA7_9CHLO|nr:hypothetical protein A3770_02p14890 [Chloropicon primus]UPQ98179.1 hypothetical protein HOP50_02g14780 [Chloropicon primus]|eukprot:QDZ18971.1 hypothetical protein A3770_02p14890 [Chloropicon primus]